MGDLDKKISMNSWEEWFVLNIQEWVKEITDKQLLDVLGDEGFIRLQKLQREQYEKLRPVWFEHAPQITKDYRKELEDKRNKGDKKAIKEMEFFQWKFAYNKDWTLQLLKLEWGKTFCPDITGNLWYRKWEEAKILAESKWYRLLTDWRDSYARQHKEETDWYKLEQYFGEYTNTWAITYMLGCVPGSYWTGTQYNDNYRSDACFRQLNESGSHRNWAYVLTCNRICGLKDSI